MPRTLRVILLTCGSVFLAGCLIWVFFLMPDMKQEQVCRQMQVVVTDSVSRRFLTAEEVKEKVRKEGVSPENKPLSDINLQELENLIDQIPVVQKAECYALQNGDIRIKIEQRRPKLRVIGEENYYVDDNRQLMPATFKTACYVPVVTGRVSRRMAQEEIYDFVDWLENNDFWNAQIEQINVKPNREIELVPRVGGHIILLGQIDDYEQKLQKLKRFYTDGLAKIGWREYRELDLRYANQVVGRK